MMEPSVKRCRCHWIMCTLAVHVQVEEAFASLYDSACIQLQQFKDEVIGGCYAVVLCSYMHVCNHTSREIMLSNQAVFQLRVYTQGLVV